MSLPPLFVEFVAGPPASGKTTYLEGKRQLLAALSKDRDERNADRHLVHCNLDPANDGVFPYPCKIDICDLIEARTVQQEEGLGPNGSYLFCVEYLGEHTDWLLDKMAAAALECARSDRANAATARAVRPVWFMMDCPGQVEFYVHSCGLAKLVRDLRKKLRAQVCLTHLCDSVVATRDVYSYVSTSLLCLTTMTDIELPQVNVLTKWDLAVEQAKDTVAMAKAVRQQKLNSMAKGGGSGGNARSFGVMPNPAAVSEEEVDSFLEAFCNTAAFAEEHFEHMWADTQMDKSIQAQLSSRGAMLQRCAGRPAPVATAAPPAASPEQPQPSSKLKKSASDEDDEDEKEAASSSGGGSKGPLHGLTKAVLGVIEGYNLVGYVPLDVNNGEMMQQLALDVDGAIGFAMHRG